MKHFRRRLFASVSVLSLILCLATVGLWVRSYWIADIWIAKTPSDLTIQLSRGGVGIEWRRWHLPPEEWYHISHAPRDPTLPKLGIRLFIPHVQIRFVAFPLWLPTLLFAIAPTYWLLGPRRTLGLCERCGYDLRASPERCPECGRAAAMQNAE